jgi:hypothetical protein
MSLPPATPFYAERNTPAPSTAVILSLTAVAAIAGLSANPGLSLLSIAVFAFIWTGALSTPVRSIFAGYLSFQWAQASAALWLANVYGVDLSLPQLVPLCSNCFLLVSSRSEDATALSLIAIASLALGTRLVAQPLKQLTISLIDVSPPRLFLAYVVLLALGRVTGPLAAGGLSQPLIVLASLKLSFVILLGFVWIASGRGLLLFGAAVMIELVLGFTGFFSDFKEVFLAVGIAFLAAASAHWRRIRPALIVGLPLLLLLGAVWTAIKPSFRAIQNQGSGQQQVNIAASESLQAARTLSAQLGASDISEGFVQLLLRLSYVDFLAAVLEYVPAVRPHESGSLWGEAIYHVLTPRILFPDKPPLPSDSERTMRYTGRSLASADAGTSISIGYVGESYVDFGLIGAVLIPFCIGTLYALMIRHLLSLGRRHNPAFLIAILVVLLTGARQFEASTIKMFPGLIWAWIVGAAVIGSWHYVDNFLCPSTQTNILGNR